MVLNCLLYLVVKGQDKIILIYSEEQATYLENPSKFKDS